MQSVARVSAFLLQLPSFPSGWLYFADTGDAIFGVISAILILLLGIWWRQQRRDWFRILLLTLLAAMVLCTASLYLFEVPPYQAGCPAGCTGYRGYPMPVALITLEGRTIIAPMDFLLNLALLWLLWLTATVLWWLLALGFDWSNRNWRFRLLFIFFLGVLPWALLPRVLPPPQPEMRGEDFRIANNGRRAAEFTYRITGFRILRLALEDVRRPLPGEIRPDQTEAVNQVCLRGYTYFYIPWQRYRVDLQATGLTALKLTPLTMQEECWVEKE